MAQDMMLYWGSGSAPCWRVQLVLEEKGLQGYNQKLVSFEKKEHKSEEILKINPRGQVPTFKHGDIVINESYAICEYLEAVFGNQGTRLIPEGQAEKANTLQRMHEAVNLQKNGSEGLVYYLWRTKKEEQTEEATKEKVETFQKELDNWEGYLQRSANEGGYLCGKFSMADIMLFPVLAFQHRMGLELGTKRPALQAYYTLMCERASVKASWPPHWKDSEPKTLLTMV